MFEMKQVLILSRYWSMTVYIAWLKLAGETRKSRTPASVKERSFASFFSNSLEGFFWQLIVACFIIEGEVCGDMAGVWMEEMQRTCWGEEVMCGEEGVVESGAIVWVEGVVLGDRRAGKLVIGSWRRAAAMRDRGGKSVRVGHGAGWGAMGSCWPHTKVPGAFWDCGGFLLISNPDRLPFTIPFHEAKADRAELVPGVVGLVTVGTTVDNVLFCHILN